MTFDEAFMVLEESDLETERMIRKCLIFHEGEERQLLINYKESEAKVLNESGTEEDYEYLIEAANGGFIEKAKKAVSKAVNAVIEFAKKILNAIRNVFSSKKSDDTMKRVKAAAEHDPKMKSVKIKVPDALSINRDADEAVHKLKRKEAQAKTGKWSAKDDKEVNDIVEGFNKKKAAKLAAGATLGIGAAIGSFFVIRKLTADKSASIPKTLGDLKSTFSGWKSGNADRKAAKKVEREVKKGAKEQLAREKKAQKKVDKYLAKQEKAEHLDASIAAAVTKVKHGEAAVEKSRLSALWKSMQNIFSGVRGKFTEVNLDNMAITKKIKAARNPSMEESYLDKMEGELFNESTITDTDEYLDDLELEIQEGSEEMTADEYLDNLELEMESGGQVTADEYLDALEEEVAESGQVTADEYLDALEDEVVEASQVTADEYLDALEEEFDY